MATLTRHETAGFLEDHDNYVILTHRRPDGDTIGSAAALCRGLRQLGKNAHILENDEVTPLLAPLVDGLTKPAAEEGDLLIAAGLCLLEWLLIAMTPSYDSSLGVLLFIKDIVLLI